MNTIEKKSVNAGKFVTKQEVDTLIRIVQTGKMGSIIPTVSGWPTP